MPKKTIKKVRAQRGWVLFYRGRIISGLYRRKRDAIADFCYTGPTGIPHDWKTLQELGYSVRRGILTVEL